MDKLDIKFQQISPIGQLKSVIDKIWLFESNRPMPRDDMKLVVPNGRLLLLMPFRNGLAGQKGGRYYLAPQNKISLVGIYRFFHLRLKGIKNQLNLLADVIGQPAIIIEQRMSEIQGIDGKIQMLQQFLLSLFIKSEEDALFDYCIQQINVSKGSHSIRQLERETGYTSRWLNLKFEERLGISPKNYSSIVRFQRFYREMLSNPNDFFQTKIIL
jgi:hypothetical protein